MKKQKIKFGLILYRKEIGKPLKEIGVVVLNKNKFLTKFKRGHREFNKHFSDYEKADRIFVPLHYGKGKKPSVLNYYKYLKDTNIALYKLSEIKTEETASPKKFLEKKFREI